jgi:hypothetical protein
MAIDKKFTRRSFLTGLTALLVGATLIPNNTQAEYRRGNQVINRIISDEYQRREDEWAADERSDQRPVPEGVLNSNGTFDLKVNGEGVISFEVRQENQDPNALTRKYDINDFIRAYGTDHWKCLTDASQARTVDLWQNTVDDSRKNICQIYADPHQFFKTMFTQDKKDAFLKFDRAYAKVIENGRTDKNVHPGLYLFKPGNGSITADYAKVHPWIDLGKPTLPDRMLIFLREYQPQVGFDNQRLRWDMINEYSK